jgi:preprotein translocase subunit SecG
MMHDIYLDASTYRVLFYAIPITIIILTVVVYYIHQKLTSKGHRRVLGWIVNPLPIKPLIVRKKKGEPKELEKKPIGKRVKFVLGQLGLRVLFFVVLAVLVAVGLELGVFMHEGGHGVVGELVGATWDRVRLGLFNGSCYVPLPFGSSDGALYYTARSWISLSGNLVETIFGIGCMLLLLLPPVRKSFFASIFFLATGIVSISSSITGWYGQSWNIMYGFPIVNHDARNFLSYQVPLGTGIGPGDVLVATTILMALLMAVCIVVPGLLWRSHYPNHRFSHWWIIGLIQALLWIEFLTSGSW